MWRNGECKERGGQCKKKGKCDDKGEQKSYIQFLCTAHLYSTKHKVVVVRSSLLQLTTTLSQQSPFQPLSTNIHMPDIVDKGENVEKRGGVMRQGLVKKE